MKTFSAWLEAKHNEASLHPDAQGNMGGEIDSIADPNIQKANAGYGPQMGPYIAQIQSAMQAAHAAGDQNKVRLLAGKLQMVIQSAKTGQVGTTRPGVGNAGDTRFNQAKTGF